MNDTALEHLTWQACDAILDATAYRSEQVLLCTRRTPIGCCRLLGGDEHLSGYYYLPLELSIDLESCCHRHEIYGNGN